MKARNAALLLTGALIVYLVLLAGRGVALVATGEVVPILLGGGVLLLPLLGGWIVVVTWRSGTKVQRLARKLEVEGGLPDLSDLPRRPSGRVDREAADEWFAQREAELRTHPEDWRSWYRVAQAYDIAGDRHRARSAMRKAITLEERTAA